MSEPAAAYIRGDDAALVADVVAATVRRLVGDGDPALVVEEPPTDEGDLAGVADAAATPPFLADRRIVVVRDVGRFTADAVAPLVAYLAEPLATTTVVLGAGGGQTPRTLLEAVKRVGEVVDAGAPTGRRRAAWVAEQATAHGVRVDNAAAALLAEHLGDDAGRVGGVLDVVAATYGADARIDPEMLRPFLGEAGAVAPWELTDAIDRGDVTGAIERVHRLVPARHPLEVMAILQTHYRRMLRLDGAPVADETAAAALLGMTGSTFPAKKALAQTKKLGHSGVARAVTLLADADLALKGELEWSGVLVLEVLVARLARLAPRPAASSRRGS